MEELSYQNIKEAGVIKLKEEIKFILYPRVKHLEPLEVIMSKTKLNWIKAKLKNLIKVLEMVVCYYWFNSIYNKTTYSQNLHFMYVRLLFLDLRKAF